MTEEEAHEILLTNDDGEVLVDREINGVMYTMVDANEINNGCRAKLDTPKMAEMVFRNAEMVQGILNGSELVRDMFDMIAKFARTVGAEDDSDWTPKQIVKREEEGSENADLS